MGKGRKQPELKEALVGDTTRGTESGFTFKKVLCIFAQFAPYFLMWYGFFLIVNDIIESNCEEDFTGCLNTRTGESNQKVTQSYDMFACPTISETSESGVVLIIGGSFTTLIMVVQFLLLVVKTGPSPFGTLRLLVWLEVAKEQGSVFSICTMFAAVVIFSATVISLVDFITKFDDNVNDLLDLVFQALTSLWTAFLLTTYNSPVTTIFHARRCPDVNLVYPWYHPSEDIIYSIHLILSLDVPTAHGLIRKAEGDAKMMGQFLEEQNLGHNDADLFASLGKGEAGIRNLEIIRDFFSHPPTRKEMAVERERNGRGIFQGASESDDTYIHEVVVRKTPDYQEHEKLLKSLQNAERENQRLRSLLEQEIRERERERESYRDSQRRGAVTPPMPPEDESARRAMAQRIEAVSSQLLMEPASLQAVQSLVASYRLDELQQLCLQPARLEQELLSRAYPEDRLDSQRERESRPRSPRGYAMAERVGSGGSGVPVFNEEGGDPLYTASPIARPVPPPLIRSRNGPIRARDVDDVPYGENIQSFSSVASHIPRPLQTPSVYHPTRV